MRQIYDFWFGPRLLTSVIAERIEDARVRAADDANVRESKDSDEPAHEFRIRLARADVQTRPLADSCGPK